MSKSLENASLESKTVQELQAIAAEAARARPGERPKARLSRAARLHLIDQLSRWGGYGLALFAGAAIFNAIVIARALPLRSSVWALMLFGALYLTRRYRKGFRRGDKIASRPFRWRAYYASSLAVVSAAFGAGAFLLVPEGTAPETAMQTLAVMLAACACAAAFHAAHRASAVAAGAPALAAIAGAALVNFGPSAFTVLTMAAGLAAALFVGVAARFAEQRAAQRFPRTTLSRREVERAPVAGRAAPASTAIAS